MCAATKPFLKWAGAKTALVPELLKWVPRGFGTYHEPFVGSGALFFALQPARAVLADANATLVKAYWGVQAMPLSVCAVLEQHAQQHNSEWYYAQRKLDPAEMIDPCEVAAWMIYMNRAGFNGLWRVNSKGRLNTPLGKTANGAPPVILDKDTILACSRALFGHMILHSDFRGVEERAVPGDFVYFDSPYAPITDGSFTAYTTDGFTHKDQADLRDLALRLKCRGVHVLLSNSPTVAPLYADCFEMRTITRAGSMSSKADGRGRVEELLIR